MIVRIEVHQHTAPEAYWQLKRCQVQVDGLMQDVSDPGLLCPIRFKTLEETIRHAKTATFTYLEKRRYKEMPDQIEWRIHQDHVVFPCPVCQQPLYRKAKLGRFGNTLDLHDWGCARCKKTVTLHAESFLSIAPVRPRGVTCPLPPSEQRIIKLPRTPWTSTGTEDPTATTSMSPVEMVISSSVFATATDQPKGNGLASLFPALLHCRTLCAGG